MAKIESTGGDIEIMLIFLLERAKIELTGVHIGFIIFIYITKLELTGGHIGLY